MRISIVGHLLCVICVSQMCLAEDKGPARPRFLLEWGQHGSEPGEFDFPIGIAITAADEVLVTDFYNRRVQKFSPAGEFISAFPVAPFPGGIAVDQDGTIYIAHFGIPPSKYDKPRERDMVAVFTPDGKPLREWGEFGEGDGQLNSPGGIVISRDGRVYVADQCNRRVQVFDKQGKFLSKWGRKGFVTGEFGGNPHPKAFFAGPTFLASDSEGNIYTTEGPLCRVQTFTSGGEFLRTWGGEEDAAGKLGGYFTALGVGNMRGPMGICFDASGSVWVAAMSGRIQQFTAQGEFLRGFGQEGTEPGEFYAPHGMAIDHHGDLYVVDAFNHRVQKFATSER